MIATTYVQAKGYTLCTLIRKINLGQLWWPTKIYVSLINVRNEFIWCNSENICAVFEVIGLYSENIVLNCKVCMYVNTYMTNCFGIEIIYFLIFTFCSKIGGLAIKLLLDWKRCLFLLNQTLYVGCKIASSESEKSNLGQRYDNDNDVIHVSSRRLALCPHTLHWVAFEKNGVDTETVPPFLFEGTLE